MASATEILLETPGEDSTGNFIDKDVHRYLSHVLVTDFYKVLSALGQVIRAFKKQVVYLRSVFDDEEVIASIARDPRITSRVSETSGGRANTESLATYLGEEDEPEKMSALADLLDPYGNDVSVCDLSTALSRLKMEFNNILQHFHELTTKKEFSYSIYPSDSQLELEQRDHELLQEKLGNGQLTYVDFAIATRNQIQRLIYRPLSLDEAGLPVLCLEVWVNTIVELLQNPPSSGKVDAEQMNLESMFSLPGERGTELYSPSALIGCLLRLVNSLGNTCNALRAPLDHDAYMAMDNEGAENAAMVQLRRIWAYIVQNVEENLISTQATAKINYSLAMRLGRTDPLQPTPDPEGEIAEELVAAAENMGFTRNEEGKFYPSPSLLGETEGGSDRVKIKYLQETLGSIGDDDPRRIAYESLLLSLLEKSARDEVNRSERGVQSLSEPREGATDSEYDKENKMLTRQEAIAARKALSEVQKGSSISFMDSLGQQYDSNEMEKRMKERASQFATLKNVMKSVEPQSSERSSSRLPLPPSLLQCVNGIQAYQPSVYSVSEGSLIAGMLGKMRKLEVPGFQASSDMMAEAAYTFQYAFNSLRYSAEKYCAENRDYVLSGQEAKQADRLAQAAIIKMQEIGGSSGILRPKVLEATGKTIESAVLLASGKKAADVAAADDSDQESNDLRQACEELYAMMNQGMDLQGADGAVVRVGTPALVDAMREITDGRKFVSTKVAESIIMLNRLLEGVYALTREDGKGMAYESGVGKARLDEGLLNGLNEAVSNVTRAVDLEVQMCNRSSTIGIPASMSRLMSLVIATAMYKANSGDAKSDQPGADEPDAMILVENPSSGNMNRFLRRFILALHQLSDPAYLMKEGMTAMSFLYLQFMESLSNLQDSINRKYQNSEFLQSFVEFFTQIQVGVLSGIRSLGALAKPVTDGMVTAKDIAVTAMGDSYDQLSTYANDFKMWVIESAHRTKDQWNTMIEGLQGEAGRMKVEAILSRFNDLMKQVVAFGAGIKDGISAAARLLWKCISRAGKGMSGSIAEAYGYEGSKLQGFIDPRVQRFKAGVQQAIQSLMMQWVLIKSTVDGEVDIMKGKISHNSAAARRVLGDLVDSAKYNAVIAYYRSGLDRSTNFRQLLPVKLVSGMDKFFGWFVTARGTNYLAGKAAEALGYNKTDPNYERVKRDNAVKIGIGGGIAAIAAVAATVVLALRAKKKRRDSKQAKLRSGNMKRLRLRKRVSDESSRRSPRKTKLKYRRSRSPHAA